ncbi:MAG: beta-glycosidase [Bacteroidaceae bacterium]|nr:beta-glycosidase [Bacteroidaceae bacterium]
MKRFALKRHLALGMLALATSTLSAQKVSIYTTTENDTWRKSTTSLSAKSTAKTVVELTGTEKGVPFRAWGTTFNELDWDAFNLLTRKEQDELMHNLFAPDGDLHFTHGRISMNANDYARAWYSCSEVNGDFGLRYFNIEHDKRNIIPLAKAAQHYYPELQLFMSPWSPPAWMKINNDYCVLSNKYNQQDPRKDYLLYTKPEDMGKTGSENSQLDPDEMKLLGDRNGVFPRRLALQDYFIQEPRYLQSYADMFCRFIELYREQGLPITKVMYQNEAYSYTPYPGCAWTAEGTLRFNNEYLAPTLSKKHPEVELWIGTFNTNRLDYVEKILDDKTLQKNIKGVGTQWECRNNLPEMRKRYPNLRFMMSESECGDGSMDWKAGEHTFFLLSDNLGNGCDEYYNWNFILTDNGMSTWGWTQNALVQVDSKTNKPRYTAEYYAYKHFSHFITPGTEMIAYAGRSYEKTPLVIFKDKQGKLIITAGNFTDAPSSMTVKIGKKYLEVNTKPHSLNTYCVE